MNGGKRILDLTIKKNKIKCCGCQSCFNICPRKAISMIEDNKGFKYPIIDKSKCIKCGLCKKACPIANKINMNNVPKAYACKNIDEDVVKKSSSGGIFSLIAQEILNSGGAVIGAAFDEQFKVKHICIQSKDELIKLYKSKYVQSDINMMYSKAKELLEKGMNVLFTGTPCQIEGLYTFLGKDFENLYTQDIICHGVPSPKVWENYKRYIEKKSKKNIENIDFRNKTYGWKKYYLKITFQDNDVYKNNIDFDPYSKLFLKDITLRDSCYECEFKGTQRRADITLADFWGVEKVNPEFDDDKGTSIVIINTEKGNKIFKSILNYTKYKEINLTEIIKYNPSIVLSASRNRNIIKFFKNYEKRDFDFYQFVNKILEEKFINKVERKINAFKMNKNINKKITEIRKNNIDIL